MGKVGLLIYKKRKMMHMRENIIKSGSDIAHEWSSMSDVEDMKKRPAMMVVKKFRLVDKYIAHVTSPALIPKRIAFR